MTDRYRPETVITREEFNIYTQILGSMLVQFAEKKDVRAYDLDVIEELRNLKEGAAYSHAV